MNLQIADIIPLKDKRSHHLLVLRQIDKAGYVYLIGMEETYEF